MISSNFCIFFSSAVFIMALIVSLMLCFDPFGTELNGKIIIWSLGSMRGMIEIFLSDK
jgi:hypothetical protein